jgi:hypothetical protein
MKTKIFVIALLSFAAIAFSGCAMLSKKEGPPTRAPSLLEPSLTLKFSDVPVPAGFKFLAQDSYSFESAGVRVGVLKYKGRANPDLVVNFYKEQMPMYNWNLLNIVEYGESLLNFERENESCIIGLLAKGRTVTITVSVGPKAQIVPRRAREPIK